MTNETKTSTRRQVIEIVAVLAAIALVLAVPVTRVALGISAQAAVDMLAPLPGQVLAGLTNVWNWIF